jgi:hypothetical protein
MELRTITDRTLLLALRADLASHAGCAVTAVGADTLDVTVHRSDRAQDLDTGTELRVRAWEDAQRARGINVRVEFVAGRS